MFFNNEQNTFQYIIENLIKTNYLTETINEKIFEIFIYNEYSIKNKYKYFFQTIHNFFLSKEQKDKFINFFSKVQKTYYALNRFAYLYKYNKTKIVVNTDMCLNPIHINDKNIISVCQNNNKYLFHINDLIQIIISALTHSHSFFSQPLECKNPYNNQPFNKSTLYNIYFFIKFKTYFHHELIHKFFENNLNITIFYNKYEYLLRDYSIENYVYKSPINIIHKEILEMIENFNKKFNEHKIVIDKDFPIEKLVHIMKPYLFLLFTSKYSMIPTRRNFSKIYVYTKLIQFYHFNSQFGRKIIKISKIFDKSKLTFKINKTIQFNDKHIQFHKKNLNFLYDHLKIINNNELQENSTFIINRLNINSNEYHNNTIYYNYEEYTDEDTNEEGDNEEDDDEEGDNEEDTNEDIEMEDINTDNNQENNEENNEENEYDYECVD